MTSLYIQPELLAFEIPGHPESAQRLAAIENHLKQAGYSAVDNIRISEATIEDLRLVHSSAYINQVRLISESKCLQFLCPETPFGRGTYKMALLAVGTTIQAVNDVLSADCHNALCLVLPPGHHACPDHGMGYCIFNNVAIGAHYATSRHSLDRVLIIDWDLHHANGTQDIFYYDSTVFLYSIHRYRDYHYNGESGIGTATEIGLGPGKGTIFNVPIERNISRTDYLIFESTLKRAAEQCQPELVLISAGFDAHHRDPIGDLKYGLYTEDRRNLTQIALEIADRFATGRIVSVLEGGYEPASLAECVLYHFEELTNYSTMPIQLDHRSNAIS